MDDSEIEALDAIFAQGLHWDYLYSRVRSLEGTIGAETLSAVSFALGHMLNPDGNELYPAYGPLPPVWQMGERVSALPPREGFKESGEVWIELAERCSAPAAVARFSDLLWAGKQGGKLGERARRATAAYLELAGDEFAVVGKLPDGSGDEGWMAYSRAQCLQRALQIALELRDAELIVRSRDATVAALRSALTERESIGAGFVLARTLARLSKEHQPENVHALLESALSLYGDTAHNYEEIADLLALAASSDEERREIRYAQVDKWLSQASTSTGLIRLVELQKAAEFARKHGLSERIDDIRRQLDGFDEAELDLKEVSYEVTIPEAVVEKFIEHFMEADSWAEALALFGAAGGSAPSGDVEANMQHAAEQETLTPMLALVPTIVVDNAGRPIRHLVEREEKLE